jgi:hypothetical protein
MPALKAGKLVVLWRPANDPFAELKSLHPSAWRGLDYVEQLRRKQRGSARIAADGQVVLFVDEARVRELWPPCSEETTEPEPRPINPLDDAVSMLSGENAPVAPLARVEEWPVERLPRYTVDQYERISAWIPKWSGFSRAQRRDDWYQNLLAAAKEADELKDIRITARLLKHVIGQSPELLSYREEARRHNKASTK